MLFNHSNKPFLLPTRKYIIIVIRLIVFSILYVIALQEHSLKDLPWLLWVILGVFVLSELVCLFEHRTSFLVQRVLGWIFVFDAALISLFIYLLSVKVSLLFITYFSVIAMAAMSKSVGMSFIVTIIVSGFYLFVSLQQGDFVFTEFITRPLFFFGIALFSGYLSEEINAQHKVKKRTDRALAQSEQKYHQLINNPLVGCYQSDLQGNILFANEALAHILEYDSSEALMRINAQTLYQDPTARASLIEQLRQTGQADTFEVDLLTRTSQTKNVMISGTLSEGIISGMIMDITARKRMEREKDKTQAQLLQIQKMDAIGTLAGGVAHDFNNILTVVKGYTELSLEGLDKQNPLHEYLQTIAQAAQGATDLTRQLLVFGRKQPMHMTAININQTITSLLKMLKRLIGEDVTIKTNLASDVWITQADKGNMEQVIMNLAVNARDAMPQGGEITIRTSNVTIDEDYCRVNTEAKPGQFVRLSLADTGMGMDKETMKHLFEPFFTTKAIDKGTGLGLSVLYGIIKQHQGWINVYSEPGQGTVFNIYLPLITTPLKEETKQPSTPATLQGNGERILLVEDEAAVRKFAVQVLQKHNYVVFVASTAQQAKQIFDQEKGNFHLLFTDTILPDINGVELVDRLQARKPGLPVIMCSGYSNEKIQHAVLKEKHLPFLQKPYSIIDLLRTIRQVIESRR